MDLICPLKRTLTHFSRSLTRYKIDMGAYILYKIVDSHLTDTGERYKVQCINTKAVLELTLEEIVFDLDMLHGLHPVQGCFIGIEYAKKMKKYPKEPPYHAKHQNVITKYSACRYGSNNLLYQDRNGYLGFISLQNGEEHVMDPRDIALSKERIQEFDAAQAFCIGVLAGQKLENSATNKKRPTHRPPDLRLVKG